MTTPIHAITFMILIIYIMLVYRVLIISTIIKRLYYHIIKGTTSKRNITK